MLSFSRITISIAIVMWGVVITGCQSDSGGSGSGGGGTDDGGDGTYGYQGPEIRSSSEVGKVTIQWDGNQVIDIVFSTDSECEWASLVLCEDQGQVLSADGGELVLSAGEQLEWDESYFFVARYREQYSAVVGGRPYFPSVNQAIKNISLDDDQIYLSGQFSQVGAATGGLQIVDDATAEPVGAMPQLKSSNSLDYPRLASARKAVSVPGSGWLVSSNARRVGNVEVDSWGSFLIRPNGSVDPGWDLSFLHGSNASLNAIKLHPDGDKIVAGGRFFSSDLAEHVYMALISVETGSLMRWVVDVPVTPDAIAFSVNDIAFSEEYMIVAGSYHDPDVRGTVSFAVRYDRDALTAPLDDWRVEFEGSVQEIAVVGDKVVFGGYFDSAEGEPRHQLAAVDLESGELQDWTVDFGYSQWSFASHDDRLFLVPDGSPDVLVFDDGLEREMSWAVADDTDHVVALHVSNGRVYVVTGDYLDTWDANVMNAYSADTLTKVNDWKAVLDARPSGVFRDGSNVLVIGGFSMAAGSHRFGHAALDRHDLGVTDWSPRSEGFVRDVFPVGNKVAIGAQVPGTMGIDRAYGLVVNKTEGDMLTEYTIGADDDVYGFAEDEGYLYIGGDFTSLGNDPLDGVAQLVGSSFDLTGWAPEGGRPARSIAAKDGRLVVGLRGSHGAGVLSSYLIGGSSEPDWVSDRSGEVNSIVITNGFVFAGGKVYTDDEYMALVVYDLETGDEIASLVPTAPAGAIYNLALEGSKLIMAGQGLQLEGSSTEIGVIDVSTLEEIEVPTNIPLSIPSGSPMAAGSGKVFVNGRSTTQGGNLKMGLVIYDAYSWERLY